MFATAAPIEGCLLSAKNQQCAIANEAKTFTSMKCMKNVNRLKLTSINLVQEGMITGKLVYKTIYSINKTAAQTT